MICKHNKKSFAEGEDVLLYLDIKNIPRVNVKVFEFNPENFYKLKKKQLDNNINLDGLIATGETVINYNEKPVVKTRKEF